MTSDATTIAQHLIRCPSVTPEEGGALNYLQTVLEELGFACQRLVFAEDATPTIDNLYARFGTTGPNLCFAGHTDVVPVGNEAAWTYPPFGGEIHDGKLFGRGAADMKGGIAAWVAGIQNLLARGWRPDGSLSLLITGDEEGPAINGTVKMLKHLHEQGERWDACITGEPTSSATLGDAIKIGRRGCLDGKIMVHGTQGHTGYPALADNAAHRLIAMCDALVNWHLDDGSEFFEPSNLAITSIDIGNPATNIIPGKATAAFNIRYGDRHSGPELVEKLRDLLTTAAGGEEFYDLDTSVAGESFLTEPGQLSDLIGHACQKVRGICPEFSTSGGTSDSRFIANYCPVVDFGPINKTIHQVDEYLEVKDLEDLSLIYAEVIQNFFE
jgi:succinyl-diaminopimelate desuccinylase